MHPLFHPLFTQFITYFNEHQDYFECHEVLEEYWKEIAPRDKTHPLTALILISTGMYHWRRGNVTGALRSFEKGRDRVRMNMSSDFYEGINIQQVVEDLGIAMRSIREDKQFSAFEILVSSHELKTLIDRQPKETPLSGEQLIHKHMLRDRSEILKLREEKRRNGR